MRNFVWILMLLLVQSTLASTHEGVEAILNFDEDYHGHHKMESLYLNVVPEKWSFPSKTKLGKRQKEKFQKALSILEEVLNSEEFKKKVLSYKRNDEERLYQKNYLWRDSDKRLTNEDVYRIIMQGNEKMRPDTIGEMNFNSYVKVCSGFQRIFSRWCRGVIGSTNPGSSKWIKLNWKFYQKFEVPKMVNNMVHEWLHLLGFLHGRTDMRKEVPYVVGGIAEEVAEGILAREQ